MKLKLWQDTTDTEDGITAHEIGRNSIRINAMNLRLFLAALKTMFSKYF
jgi:hypothetical protein